TWRKFLTVRNKKMIATVALKPYRQLARARQYLLGKIAGRRSRGYKQRQGVIDYISFHILVLCYCSVSVRKSVLGACATHGSHARWRLFVKRARSSTAPELLVRRA